MTQQDKQITATSTALTAVDLYRIIVKVWAADTASPSSPWSSTNPAQNHCSITSLVVQDYCGGTILSTQTIGGTHFYNLIDGKKWDLTVSQFTQPIPYDDTPSSRATALADTSERKYQLLTSRLMQLIPTQKNSLISITKKAED